MPINYDFILQYLFKYIYNGYDAFKFIDIIWQLEKQDDIEEYFDVYIHQELSNMKPENKQELPMRKQVLNCCLFINRKILPKFSQIKTNDELKNYEAKVSRSFYEYKLKWYSLVETHAMKDLKNLNSISGDYNVADYIEKNPKIKYIFKDYLHVKSQHPDETLNRDVFLNMKLDEVKAWRDDSSCLLSSFPYYDDLQKNQIKLIMEMDTLYALFHSKELHLDNKVSFDIIGILSFVKTTVDDTAIDLTFIPSFILTDYVFRVEAISKDKNNNFIHDDDEKDFFLTMNEKEILCKIPKHYESPHVKRSFHYPNDKIKMGGDELRVLISLLKIGKDRLVKSNKISFLFSDICKALNIKTTSHEGDIIRTALFMLKIHFFYLDGQFHSIISSIERPIYNSNRELVWTIELNEAIVQEYQEHNGVSVVVEYFSDFRREISPILYKLFLHDVLKSGMKEFTIIYTLTELSNRLVLSGKPSLRLNKILEALEDIKNSRINSLMGYRINSEEIIVTFKIV